MQALDNIPHISAEISASVESIAESEMETSYFLQSQEWASIKNTFGWEVFTFRQRYCAALETDVLVLVNKIALGTYFAYIPDGILIPTQDFSNLEILQDHLRNSILLISAIAQKLLHEHNRNVFCIRWDVPWLFKKTGSEEEFSQKYRKQCNTFMGLVDNAKLLVRLIDSSQPPASVVLDLTQDEETLLSTMKSKTRYNTKLASKRGVQIRDDVGIDEFYALYEYTSRRNKIAIHSREYYQKVYDEIVASGKHTTIRVYGAEYQGDLIAAIVVVHYRTQAVYLYGASSDVHRNLMPAYALQWYAIHEAKSRGCTSYDMFGIPLFDDKHHRMYGVYKFKIGFGGEVRYRIGAFELGIFYGKRALVRKFQYTIFRLVEQLRMWYYYKYRK